MKSHAITVRGGDYEHVQRIAGEYGAINLAYESRADLNALFSEVLASKPYEVCEFSLANYLTLRAAGQNDFIAIPVFPNRAFRHATLVTRRNSALEHPSELEGKRVGVYDYSMSAAVWARGLLSDEYGVDLDSITWVSGKKQRFPVPHGVKIEMNEKDIETLLVDLSDPESAERDYFARTSIYPINHCVIVRKDVAQNLPEIVGAVARAYLRAKEDAYRRRIGSTLVPWGKNYWDKTFNFFGDDPIPYGLTPQNRSVISLLCRYLQEQGLIKHVPSIDSLFAVPDCLAQL
jgi:4,5-dihydroxyphthalate decarboxylase